MFYNAFKFTIPNLYHWRKILSTIYDDAEGEFVDEEFVDVCITLADKNNDGVLQIEGKPITCPEH